MPYGVTVTLPYLSVNGVCPVGGDYSGEDWIEGGGTVTVGNEGIASWKAPVDGRWSVAANWTGGAVPTSGDARVTAEGADYSVLFDAAAVEPARITVGNDTSHVSRIVFQGDVAFVTNNAASFTVRDGGAVEVASGMVAFTNDSAMATVSGSGVWRVSGGTNDVKTYGTHFLLKDGGTLQVTSGLFRIENKRFAYGNPMQMTRGNIEVSGNGCLQVINAQGTFNPLGSGTISVGGDGSLVLGRAFAGPNVADAPLRISLSGNGKVSSSAGIYLGDTVNGGTTMVDLSGGSSWVCDSLNAIGLNRACRVRMDIGPDARAAFGGMGVYVGGMQEKKEGSACCPTGVVNVVGGELNGGGGWYSNKSYLGAEQFVGAIVGGIYGTNSYMKSERLMKGEINVTDGGTYTQQGYLCVGIESGGRGIVRADGGTVSKTGGGETLVGVFGGQGLLKVAGGGSVSLSRTLYAGGVDPATLEVPRRWSSMDISPTTATGRVSVVDGTLSASGGIVLGARGTGLLDIGSNGVVTATSLVLSNNVASALAFTFGENGVGSVELSGALAIAYGAKLRIDATAYAGTRGRFHLLSASSVDGAFGVGDVEIVDTDGRTTFAVDAHGIWVRRQKGVCLIFR